MSEEKTEETNLVPEEKLNIPNDNKQSNQTEDFKPWGMELKQFCVLMHAALLIFPILSIVMWATNKENSDLVDEHGKNILNAFISYFIWTMISCGFAGILFLIFIIIGIVKASEGQIYKYPLSITFVK